MSLQPTGRSVILLVLDSARADLFISHASNFVSLSGDGARFDMAVAPSGWTLPSHASMFTGLSPTEHGLVAVGKQRTTEHSLRNAKSRASELVSRGKMLVPLLSKRGVRTLSTSSSPWLWQPSGLATGFRETDFFYFLDSKPMKRGPWSGWRRHLFDSVRSTYRYARWLRANADKGAERAIGSIERFARQEGPFFAFANLIETHEPHVPPVGYGGKARKEAALEILLEPPILRILRMRAHNYGVRPFSARKLERWRSAYIEEIRYVDEWLLRLTERLSGAGLLDRTTVIVTSDHGELIGERNLVGHGLTVSQEAAHVPLGMWGGGIPLLRTDLPVSLMQIPATVKHLHFDESKEGSLLSEGSWGKARMEVEDPRAVLRPPARARRLPSGPGAAFFDGALKLVCDPFAGVALYDLQADPHETKNLLPDTAPTEWQEAERLAWQQRARQAAP